MNSENVKRYFRQASEEGFVTFSDYQALEEQLKEAMAYRDNAEPALIEFRDSVLNERHQLEDAGMDSDKTNAVLSLFDDLLGDFLPLPPQPEAIAENGRAA